MSAYVQFEDTSVHVASGIVIPILVVGGNIQTVLTCSNSALCVCVSQVCSGRQNHWRNG